MILLSGCFTAMACGGGDSPPSGEERADAAAPQGLACQTQAQGGGCSEILVPNSSNYFWVSGENQPTSRYAGKTLCIPAGTYTGIGLYKVVASASQPAVITNCGGQAIFHSTSGSPFYVGGGSRHLRISGTGSAAHTYGLVAGTSGKNQAHLDLREGTSDVEIDHVEVSGNGNGGVGIAFRTYPACSGGTWRRGTWAQYNTKIHDTYVHGTKYEGMYIGPSHHGWVSANDYTPGFDCSGGVRWTEADVVGVEVTDNRLENIGNDGIQVGGALQGMTIRRNVIKDYGLNQDESHSGGITVNPGSKGLIDSNWIEATQAYRTQGIAFQGLGGSVVSNNVILGARWGTMFLRNSDVNLELSLPDVAYYHNTVVNSTYQGLFFFCNNLDTVLFKNNIVAGTPTLYAGNGGNTACVQSLSSGNLLNTQLSAAGFVNAAAKDFHLLPASAAVNTGMSLEGVVNADHDGVSRLGSPYDLGAFAQ
ncbi:right-handed parallel beta-helix repeat-containing protein [Stigmatella sp. ncwal1]|uniref:Right-handed parallel beta-helix repeat-containing protein n=1 Tax=Stigmatella ashevillensis TaxID=2995309 RepID=A0ABT5D307_9BACT|nr:right-handed parallel beta-helix repeat-containing protein [Stigmatella ashevillena]MDC0707439.1 right-handed parallel beta-helix repeat-containing protein [Stigmatella ashevillena]